MRLSSKDFEKHLISIPDNFIFLENSWVEANKEKNKEKAFKEFHGVVQMIGFTDGQIKQAYEVLFKTSDLSINENNIYFRLNEMKDFFKKVLSYFEERRGKAKARYINVTNSELHIHYIFIKLI